MKKALINRALPLLVTFILALGMVFGSFSAAFAAEEVKELAFDKTSVLTDLTSSTDEEGNPFDLTDYPYDESGHVQLITFVEYCYGYAANLRNNYGLYIYIYNPQNLSFDTDSPLNKAQLGVAWDEDGKITEYEKFDLLFCSRSGGDYAGLFYKFRIVDHVSDTDGKTIAERVNSNGRVYSLSGFELLTEGETNATEYGVGGTFTYTGYAAGYGADEEAESTLACDVTDLETLETEVHYTTYRPEGTILPNGEQDQLDSVFFSVPDYLIETYGAISAITMEWYEYQTNWFMVLPDEFLDDDDFAALNEYATRSIQDLGESDYLFPWANTDDTGTFDYISAYSSREEIGSSGWYYDEEVWYANNDEAANRDGVEIVNYIAGYFGRQWGDDASIEVSGAELIEHFMNVSEGYDGELINGKYAETLFTDEVDEGHVRGYNKNTIDTAQKRSLTSYYLTQSFWQEWFGLSTMHPSTYGNIETLHPVTEDDLEGTDEEVADRLYMSENDVPALRAEFVEAEATERTLMLFRFSTSKYYSLYASIHFDWTDEDILAQNFAYSGYTAKETVYLDLDIISITFYKDGVYTVIPVVASPIDGVGGLTDPNGELIVDTDDGNDWWWILLIVVLVVVVILLLIFAPQVFVLLFKAIFFVISLPFRAIAALAKAISKSLADRKDKPKKDKSPPRDKPKGDGGGGSGGKAESPPVVNVYVGGSARSTAKKAGGTAKAARTSETVARGKRAGGAKAVKTAGSKAAGGEKKRAARSQSGTNVTARGGEKTRAGNRANGKNVTAKKNGK